MTAEEYYQQGNAWRKQGDFKRALDAIWRPLPSIRRALP